MDHDTDLFSQIKYQPYRKKDKAIMQDKQYLFGLFIGILQGTTVRVPTLKQITYR